jgi:hypothetical protein
MVAAIETCSHLIACVRERTDIAAIVAQDLYDIGFNKQ